MKFRVSYSADATVGMPKLKSTLSFAFMYIIDCPICLIEKGWLLPPRTAEGTI